MFDAISRVMARECSGSKGGGGHRKLCANDHGFCGRMPEAIKEPVFETGHFLRKSHARKEVGLRFYN